MKIAVTGGFGFVGHHLINRLSKDNHDITIVAHKTRDSSLLEKPVHVTHGSVNDVDSLKSSFSGVEAVYHLVGIIAETKTKSFDKTVMEGTKNVIRAAKETSVRKIIYLSALGTSENAISKYHQTKYQAEQSVINSGIPYVIFRPSIIYGKGDGFVSMLTRMMKLSPFLPVIGGGRYKMQPVYIDDLTDVMAQAVALHDAENKIFDIGGPEKLEYLQILHILTQVCGKKRLNLFLPKAFMLFIASVLEKIIKPAPITKDQILMMDIGNTGDISLMKKIFHIDPIRFEDGLRKYMR